VDAVSLKVAEGRSASSSALGAARPPPEDDQPPDQPDLRPRALNGQDTSGIDEVELRRHIGYVIQQIGLFPNMTIEENITIVPRLLGWDKKRCHERATELMAMVALDPKKFLKRYPRELSGRPAAASA
jgi:osmoprotectant transport system ATP-binding protein